MDAEANTAPVSKRADPSMEPPRAWAQWTASDPLGNVGGLPGAAEADHILSVTRSLIPNLAGDAKLVRLSALSAKGQYSAPYLRQLVLAVRLHAVREGRLHLSSKAW